MLQLYRLKMSGEAYCGVSAAVYILTNYFPEKQHSTTHFYKLTLV